MKKILLSVIALFAAVSMNAQTKVGAADGAFDINQPDASKWGGTWYTFASEGTEENFDASAYDYVWIKFSGNTGKFRFGITYNEWKSTEAWGETFFDEVKYIEDAEGIVWTKLEKDKTYEFGGPDKAASQYAGDTWDKHIKNVYTQDDGQPVSVKVEGIWFGTEAQLAAIIEGGEPSPEPTPEPTADDWTTFFQNNGEDVAPFSVKYFKNYTDATSTDGAIAVESLDPEKVYEEYYMADQDGNQVDAKLANDYDTQLLITLPAPLPAGTKFKISMKVKADKAATAQTQCHLAAPEAGAIEGKDGYKGTYIHWALMGDVPFTTDWDTFTTEATVPSEGDGMQAICLNLEVLKEVNTYYFDDITVSLPSDNPLVSAIQKIQVVKAENGARYNLAGQKVGASYKGIVIQNGKKYIQK